MHSCQGFCSISRVGPQGLCVWSNSLKWGAGNTYKPLHDHPYSDVNIIYSVVEQSPIEIQRKKAMLCSQRCKLSKYVCMILTFSL
jgi:hypothetical protein